MKSSALSESDAQGRDLGNDVNRRKWLTKSRIPQRTIEAHAWGGHFLAAEAYLSEGLQHIVFGNQSGNLEAMAEANQSILESVNEQTGDFMKDMGHYGDSDGKAFIQTAKYLSQCLKAL